VGEAAERYSAGLVAEERLVFASAAELGPDALAPERIRLFRDEQLGDSGFVQLDRTTQVRWTPGVELPGGSPVWLPAQLVYLGGLPDRPPEPMITIPTSNGLACGATRDAAVLSGLLELVERDAFSIVWANRLALPRLTWDGDPVLEAFEDLRLVPSGLDYAAIDLSPLLEVPVVLAVVSTPSGFPGPTTLGAAAAPTPGAAARRALAEAFAAYAAARAFTRAQPDRVLAPDGADIETFDDRVRFYADPARRGHVAFLASATERRRLRDVRPLTSATPAELTAELCERLAACGARAYAADVTAPDVGAAGLHVVRVMSPELCPLDAVHRQRFLGVPRLLTAAHDAGLRPCPLRIEEVNSHPHPFP
jgi:ribosomal protein S12 methylthiotransferase accessory factor